MHAKRQKDMATRRQDSIEARIQDGLLTRRLKEETPRYGRRRLFLNPTKLTFHKNKHIIYIAVHLQSLLQDRGGYQFETRINSALLDHRNAWIHSLLGTFKGARPRIDSDHTRDFDRTGRDGFSASHQQRHRALDKAECRRRSLCG